MTGSGGSVEGRREQCGVAV